MSIEIFNIDCMDYMVRQVDNAFDLAIVDPPYGIGDFQQKSGNISKLAQKRGTVNWNNNIPSKKYFDEVRRVSINQIIWGWNYFTEILGSSNNLIFWEKSMGARSYSAGEIAWTSFSRSLCSIDIPLLCENNRTRIHPCQKPVKLYKRLLTDYAKPGQKILDTHLGSGSSAIAAYHFGCNFVGCETDKDYYTATIERFNKECKQ